MKLTTAILGPYKSMITAQTIIFEETVTVLVGQNEAGKSAILEALNKTRPVANDAQFSIIEDYPRKDVTRYEREHPKGDTEVAKLSFKLTDADLALLRNHLQFDVPDALTLTLSFEYSNQWTIGIVVDENIALDSEIARAPLTAETKKQLRDATTYQSAAEQLEKAERNEKESAYLASLKSRIDAGAWPKRLAAYETYQALKPYIPMFLYFGDYNSLPGKTNLTDLQRRRDGSNLRPKDRAVLALLRMAGIDLNTLAAATSYEAYTARLQGFSNEITDRVFEYWKQNNQLEVRFDVKADPQDAEVPFNNGANLYIRIYNRRHRVDVSFDQRSRGFIWFFSFVVWFDDAQAQADATTPIILLLDEPGLSLHALAQADFLRYIEDLGKAHQVIYTTHSPFLVRSESLGRVRVIEDRDNTGTTVIDRLDSSDPKSLFPLQAALGYTIAQNLFISERNLLVEGPADLIYLQAASAALEQARRHSLEPQITIVPVGGLDKVATFVSLLYGNNLKIAVCLDLATKPDQRMRSMVEQKILEDRALFNFSMFRNQGGKKDDPTDVEDLFAVSHYVAMFNKCYASELKKTPLMEADLQPGTRIVQRIDELLKAKALSVRKSGGCNHFLVASRAAASGIEFENFELDAFEALFKQVNKVLA